MNTQPDSGHRPRGTIRRRLVDAVDAVDAVDISHGHDGVLEVARMELADRSAVAVALDERDAAFIRSFATARLATSDLLRGATVTWTRALAPAPMNAVRS